MADKSRHRRGSVVRVMRGKLSRLTSESSPISERYCTGRPGKIDAAASAEPRKEVSKGNASRGRYSTPVCKSDSFKCRKAGRDAKNVPRMVVYGETPFVRSALNEQERRFAKWQLRIIRSRAWIGVVVLWTATRLAGPTESSRDSNAKNWGMT